MSLKINRREAIAVGIGSIASLALSSPTRGEAPSPFVLPHDEHVEGLLNAQVTDPQSRWCGAIPDGFGIHYCNAAAGFLRAAAAARVHSQSRFFHNAELLDRMRLAAAFMGRFQNAEGNIDLLSTNFNSPPDTGFVVHNVGSAARIAQMHGDADVVSLLQGFLLKAGEGLIKGGIHTPNHRWAVCAALAQINELFPDARYIARIDQWLGEGIDQDEEGQYTERSTAGYNTVVDTALLVTALKLNRPELLDPVRKNLDAMAYLLHPNGEVVTEISSRQDLNTRGTMGGYWFVLRYLALQDQNGLYAAMLTPLEPQHAELPRLLEYPELQQELPAPTPIPADYEREYERSGITRIRRGKTSVTILHKENSRWISLRHGEAVINAVRFASAFFGKGQFIPAEYEKRDGGYHFKQHVQGRYLQPLTDPSLLPVRPDTWSGLVAKRTMTEICHMNYEAQIREVSGGFEITIQADGTDNVPLSVEINLREGGAVTGASAVPGSSDAFLLKDGFAEYTMGRDVIRIGPGIGEHTWLEVRGAQARLSGPSVYLTSYTPFRHTLTVQMG